MDNTPYIPPDPQQLFDEAEAEIPKPNLRLYLAAMSSLRRKGYSFADVAKWMTERLGVKITRSQVAYVLTAPAEVLEADEEAEALEQEADRIAEENQLGDAVTHVNGKKVAE